MSTIESKDSRELNRGEKPLRQQPTTSVTMLWNIVNGLKIVLGEEYEDNDPRIILYQKTVAEFMEKYKLWAKSRIEKECNKLDFFLPVDTETKDKIIKDIYLIFYQMAVDPKFGSLKNPNIQKALVGKTEKNKPFISYIQTWIRLACIEWMSQKHFFRKKKGAPPPMVIRLDKPVTDGIEEEDDNVSYLEVDDLSKKIGDGRVHGFPATVSALEAEDLIPKIKRFSYQILLESVRIPDDSESSKIGNQLAKEFISNPRVLQKELAAKYGIDQQDVSYHKRKWIRRKVVPQLKKYQPGHSNSGCIDNSPEIFRWLVEFVEDKIGEKVL